jgi:hypothetical protein
MSFNLLIANFLFLILLLTDVVLLLFILLAVPFTSRNLLSPRPVFLSIPKPPNLQHLEEDLTETVCDLG